MICPYKGLARFEFSDADYFFGREELVADTVARVVGSAFLAVVGPSGSGKSSLVRAGLLPALRDGVLPEGERWLQLIMSPGAHPVRELVRRLASLEADRADGDSALAAINRTCSVLPRGSGLLLFVDQLEEVFTTCEDDYEREEFLAALVSVALRPESAVTVVVTMRSD